jgi:hypothetical protein
VPPPRSIVQATLAAGAIAFGATVLAFAQTGQNQDAAPEPPPPPVCDLPAITTEPASQTVTAGSLVTFYVEACGSAPLSYQWAFNGNTLVGATASVLTLPNVQFEDAGS